jgi:hypothetical protein
MSDDSPGASTAALLVESNDVEGRFVRESGGARWPERFSRNDRRTDAIGIGDESSSRRHAGGDATDGLVAPIGNHGLSLRERDRLQVIGATGPIRHTEAAGETGVFFRQRPRKTCGEQRLADGRLP